MKDIKIVDVNETGALLKNFLHSTLREIMSVVDADCGSLFLFDPEHKELILDSFYNSGNLHIEGLRQRIGEGISGKVAQLKVPVLVNNINTDARFNRNGFSHYRTNSFISVPLVGSEGILGLINIADKSTGGPFSEKDLQFAVVLAKYACVIVENLLHSSKLKIEKEALHKQKSLLEKYASVGKLAAGVVHEINNPLDGIIRYTNISLEQVENNSIAREYLLEVKKGLNRIANTTKSLLEFSYQVNSGLSQAKKFVDLHKSIDESLDVLKEKARGPIRIDKKYMVSLPRIRDFGIQHVAINLIKNALDAMPAGGVLEISTDIKDSAVEIVFQDTGTGIQDEVIGHIFEPFFTTKTIDKGTGLGLSICNEIINKYTGSIRVQSSPGKGSKFTILIPKEHLENA